jgi:hypothetical protein
MRRVFMIPVQVGHTFTEKGVIYAITSVKKTVTMVDEMDACCYAGRCGRVEEYIVTCEVRA